MSFKVRDAREEDFSNGFLESLSRLRPVDDVTPQEAVAAWRKIIKNPLHRLLVGVIGQQVVAVCTVFLEPKIIHHCGIAGHIEDVATHNDHRGNGYGKHLVRYAIKWAREQGAYKVILDCDKDMIPYYASMGFDLYGHAMKYDFSKVH